MRSVLARLKALLSLGTFGVLLLLMVPHVSASCNPNQQSCSSGYGVNEVFFGTGGALCDPSNPSTSEHSANYCAKTSVGELGVGNTASNNYQAQAGFNTDRVPSLTFIVNPLNVDLGTLTAGTTVTATATFSVATYLASGYQIMTESPPPQNGAYTMQTSGSATASNSSQEQFGMNLVANTIPAALAGPSNDPACQTSGFCDLSALSIDTNYNQTNKYYYPASGSDTLLTSGASSGTTNFTVSYIFNTTNTTPGGTYTFDQILVATSTF